MGWTGGRFLGGLRPNIEPTIASLDTVGGGWAECYFGVGSRRHSDGSLAGCNGRSEGPYGMLAGGSAWLFTAHWPALPSRLEVTLLSSRRRFEGSLTGCDGWSECPHRNVTPC